VTEPEAPPVTIAIPVFATPPALLEACLRSIADATGPADEVFVVVDGPQSPDIEDVVRRCRAFGFQVVRQPSRVGLVANWNACLGLGHHEIVHVMHADDAVSPEFYARVRRGMTLDNIAVVAAGRPPVTARTVGRPSTGDAAAAIVILRGQEAATYLLSRDKPATGSFVIRRSLLGVPVRGFDQRFSYCPDEELFLRVLAFGSLALVSDRLYVESRHDLQARYGTWRRADFADIYYAARATGASQFGEAVIRSARRQTSRRLLGVGRNLYKTGDRRAVRAILRSIAAHDKISMLTWRYWALFLMASTVRDRFDSTGAEATRTVTRTRSNP
jgi:glycosyltransferase involved in cell wall biosynthesis